MESMLSPGAGRQALDAAKLQDQHILKSAASLPQQPHVADVEVDKKRLKH
jgi:hypothetical protein